MSAASRGQAIVACSPFSDDGPFWFCTARFIFYPDWGKLRGKLRRRSRVLWFWQQFYLNAVELSKRVRRRIKLSTTSGLQQRRPNLPYRRFKSEYEETFKIVQRKHLNAAALDRLALQSWAQCAMGGVWVFGQGVYTLVLPKFTADMYFAREITKPGPTNTLSWMSPPHVFFGVGSDTGMLWNLSNRSHSWIMRDIMQTVKTDDADFVFRLQAIFFSLPRSVKVDEM